MAKVTSKGDVRIRVDTQYNRKQLDAAMHHLKETERYLTSMQRTSRATTSSMIEGWQRIKSKWLEVAASVLALKTTWDFAEEAAKFKQTEQAFTNMAASYGVDAQRLITDLKRVSAQTISTAKLMQVAGSAMLLGIPADKLAKMMEIARASARITGQTIQQAFQDIALGVGRQSKLILDNLGIVIRLEDAYRKYAQSMGTTVEKLTDAQKKQAFLNAVMQAGEDTIRRVNLQAVTMKEMMEQLKAWLQDKLIWFGKVAATMIQTVRTAYHVMVAALAGGLSELSNKVAKLFELMSKLPWVGDKFAELAQKAREYAAAEEVLYEQEMKRSKEYIESIKNLWGTTKAVVDKKKLFAAAIEKEILLTKKRRDAEAMLKKIEEEAARIEEQRRRQFELAEEKIYRMQLAVERLTANKELLLQIEAREFARQGANAAQIERYIRAYRELLELRALEELARLEEQSPYQAVPSTELERIYFEYDQKLRALQEFNARKLQLLHEAGAKETELARQYAELRMAYTKKEHELRLQVYASALGATSNFFQNLFVATGSGSKKLFELQKAFSIAQAIMDTYAAANKAMASLPWPLSMAAAAATIAAGMARVRQIMSLKPTGATASISASGAANPAYRGGSYSAYPPPQRTETAPQITIQIQNPITGSEEEWERLVEERIAPAIKRVVDRNVEVI